MGAGVTTGLLVVPRGGLLTGDLLLERGRIAPIIDNIMSDPNMIRRNFILYLVYLHRINSLPLKTFTIENRKCIPFFRYVIDQKYTTSLLSYLKVSATVQWATPSEAILRQIPVLCFKNF